ncbi:hypothetical protein B0H17DRAFT_981717, partial [Mycena rosella]
MMSSHICRCRHPRRIGYCIYFEEEEEEEDDDDALYSTHNLHHPTNTHPRTHARRPHTPARTPLPRPALTLASAPTDHHDPASARALNDPLYSITISISPSSLTLPFLTLPYMYLTFTFTVHIPFPSRLALDFSSLHTVFVSVSVFRSVFRIPYSVFR